MQKSVEYSKIGMSIPFNGEGMLGNVKIFVGQDSNLVYRRKMVDTFETGHGSNHQATENLDDVRKQHGAQAETWQIHHFQKWWLSQTVTALSVLGECSFNYCNLIWWVGGSYI